MQETKIQSTTLVFLFFCVIFNSIGFNSLFSASVIGLFLMLEQTIIKRRDLKWFIFFIILALESTLQAYFSFSGLSYEIELGQIRLVLVFALTYLLMGLRFKEEKTRELIKKYNIIFLKILVFGIAVQRAFKEAGVDIYMPEYLFSMSESGTVLNPEKIEFLKNIDMFEYRVSLFYQEPSYFGAVILCLLVVGLSFAESKKERYQLFMYSIAGNLIAETFYGIAAAGVMFATSVYSNKRRNFNYHTEKLSTIKIFAFSVVISGIVFTKEIFDRLLNMISLKDVSLLVRAVDPFILLELVFFKVSIFGYPVIGIYDKLSASMSVPYFSDPPLHNGFLNIFLGHGIVALVLLFLIYKRVKKKILFIFFCLIMMQNGSYGGWDKAFLISFVCVLVNSCNGFPARKPNEKNHTLVLL